MKPFSVAKACTRSKTGRCVSIIFFVLMITLMLSGIFSEALMSISNKHNCKTLTKSSPTSLSHFMKDVLNHSSGKCRDFLTRADLSFTKLTSLCQCNIYSLSSR